MGKYGAITLTDSDVCYRRFLGKKQIPYADLVQAYRQLEDVRGKVC